MYIHSVIGRDADIDDDIMDDTDDDDVVDGNDNDDIFDEDYKDEEEQADDNDDTEVNGDEDDEDDDVEERDTFDLDCDDDDADDFFSSDMFRNAVELLDRDEIPRPPPAQPPTRKAETEDDNEDPPPPKPDVSGMDEEDAAAAVKVWRKQRKAWTDRRARQRRHQRAGIADLIQYTGDSTRTLRLMSVVQQRRLMSGESFETKDILRMRIAEEANLGNKEITTVRSDKYQLLVVGEDFYVKANNTERRGWVVSTAVCRDGDGPMPENAASRKIKWLGKHAKNNNCIDLVQSDDDDDDDEDDVAIARVVGGSDSGLSAGSKSMEDNDVDDEDGEACEYYFLFTSSISQLMLAY